MNFKLDENLPAEVAADLRALGHGAETVCDEGLSGAPDSTLLDKVKTERRVFLTLGKGVANIQEYPPGDYAGLVLFRPDTSGRGAVLRFVRRHIPAVLQSELAGRLLVVSERGLRIR